jgi:hypothetical protein
MEALVDPEVSHAKFNHEVGLFRNLEQEYRKRGWFMLSADYPRVFVVFASPKIHPHVLAFGLLADFQNYDFWPPSVRLVNPFTQVPYTYEEAPTKLERRVTKNAPNGPAVELQPLLQPGCAEGDVPFVCLPGFREYHDNPAHTSDPWLRHRGTGIGSLSFVLEQVSKYGLDPLSGYAVNMQIVQIGLSRNLPPE